MTSDQPQPGDVWERDAKCRHIVWIGVSRGSVNTVVYVDNFGAMRCWQSGATLVDRKEPTQ